MKTKLILATLLALGLLAAITAAALSWSDGVDPVSGFGPDFMISLPRDQQAHPAIAYNSTDDEYLVVWSDHRPGTVEADIYGQIFSAGGIPQGDNFMVSDAGGEQDYPYAAYNSTDGNYMVVWRDRRGADYDVYGQLVSATGELAGANFAVNTDANDQRVHDIVYDPDANHYLVVWGDTGDNRAEGQLLDNTGGLIGTSPFTITGSGGDLPRAAYDSNRNSYVVVYAQGAADIYGQAVAADGSLSGAAFAICTASDNQSYPDVEFNANRREYLVVWWDRRNSATTNTDIYGRRINQDGVPQGNEIAISNAADVQTMPRVTYNSRVNQWLVAWEDHRNQDVSDTDIYGQRVLTQSLATQGNFIIYDGPEGQWSVALAARPTTTGAEFLAAWGDARNGYKYEIVAQRIAALTGALKWHDFNVSAPLGSQENPDVVYNPNAQQFLVVWQDGRQNEWDIYGQIVLTSGIPLTDNIVIRDEANTLIDPVVAHSTISNTYLVVWDDQNEGDIEGRVIDADGNVGGALNVFDTAGFTATQPAIAYNAVANEYLVVFARQTAPNNWDIYGRLVLPNGTVSGTPFAICDGADDQIHPDVDYNAANDTYFVVWADERDLATTGWDIYGQLLTASGVLTVSGPVSIVSNATGEQNLPAVVWSEDYNEYLVVWRDARNPATAHDLYGQRMNASGGLLGSNFGICTAAGNQTAPHVNYISTIKRYSVLWADDRNGGDWDIYSQGVNGDGSLYGGAVPFFAFTGWQQRPAGDYSPEANRGLTAWQDGRNGATAKIYGRLKEPRFPIYLPLVTRL